MAKLEYSPVALEKIGAIHRYISEEQKSPDAAAATIDRIREKIRGLKYAPKIGAPLASRSAEVPEKFLDARVLLCGTYLAVYLYYEETVKILAVYHTTEDYIRHLYHDKS